MRIVKRDQGRHLDGGPFMVRWEAQVMATTATAGKEGRINDSGIGKRGSMAEQRERKLQLWWRPGWECTSLRCTSPNKTSVTIAGVAELLIDFKQSTHLCQSGRTC